MHARGTPGKSEYRARIRSARAALGEADRASAREAVRTAVLARAAAARWTCVAAYEPLRAEPGSTQLLAELSEHGIRVLVPVTLADRDLDWAEWSAGGPRIPLGRDALRRADAVLVPAFAVAADGTRLGRGGGSYDRALPRRRPGVPVAALLFDGEFVAALPRDDWDEPVTAVVTPDGWREIVPE